MKRRYIIVPVLFLALISCDRDYFDQVSQEYSLKIRILYPEYYTEGAAEGVTVKLVNQANTLYATQVSDASGLVEFNHIMKGTYRISAGIKLSAEEAVSLGDTVPSAEDVANGRLINLNANRQDIFVDASGELEALNLRSSIPGTILIKEVFYTGTTTPAGKAYYSDHFVELYNNTAEVIYADSIYISNCYGSNGSSDSEPSPLQSLLPDTVALEFVWMVPGNGHSWPIEPGKSLIIAQDGMNHRDDPNGNPNSIDLSVADLETYLYRPDNQRDVDIMEVPNMTEVFYNRPNTHDWILHSYGATIVIFKVQGEWSKSVRIIPEPYDTEGHEIALIPSGWILDGFEGLAYSRSGKYKRIPVAVDAGFQYCNGIFNGQSCRRKVEDQIDGRLILQDFNNSSEDFEIIPFPTPGIVE